MRIWLTHEQVSNLVEAARRGNPHEVCGILAGQGEQVRRIIPIANVAANPESTYRMDERALVNTLLQLQREQLDLVAFYHSHPQHEPRPSSMDIQQATYPETPYLIIGLRPQVRLAAWLMSRYDVQAVELYIGITKPPPLTPPMTLGEKQAIVLTMIIAFTIVIYVALTLLPPAPVIPRP